ncbi:MAG: hypothetical protein Q8M15_03450 [Bacteroidota bacterium]|nr:hypothetical protein [Bacteroidota bacterium]
MKKFNLLFVLLLILNFWRPLYAQFGSASMVKSGLEDANKLFGAYVTPMLTGWASGLNNGWFNTAKSLGTGGFALTLSGGGFFVPPEAQTYNLLALNLKNTRPSSVDATIAPTLFGTTNEGPKMDVMYRTGPPLSKDFPVGSFNLPGGYGYYFFPTIPNIQLSLGIIKSTELMLRFIPGINLKGIQSNVFGFGIKHDIIQWIPVVKDWKFNVSFVAAYSNSNAEYLIPEEYRLYPDDYTYPNAREKSFYDNQKFGYESQASLIGFVVSKDIKFVTPYAGLSYNKTFIRFLVLGNYPMPVYDPTTSVLTPTIQNVADPIALENKDNAWRANLGLRVKLWYITLHGEYTLARYNTVTAGVGFNLQSLYPFVR